MKGLYGAAALVLVWLGFLFIPALWPPSKVDPCTQVNILKNAIEQDRRDRIAERIEAKKEALDDQLDRLQMSPEQYRNLHEKLDKVDQAAAPAIAREEARRQEQLDRNVKLLAEAEANCNAKDR